MTETLQPFALESETSEHALSLLMDELGLALRWQRPLLGMVVYGSEYVLQDSVSMVENFVFDHDHTVNWIYANAEGSSEVRFWFEQFKDAEDTVYFVDGMDEVEDVKPLFTILEHYRYLFVEKNVRIVFWLTHKDVEALVLHAPRFWSSRNIFIELEGAPRSETILQKALESTWQGTGEYTSQFDDTDEKISFRESILTGLPQETESTSMRANMLLALGLLNWRRGDYEKAEELLNSAMNIATHMQDNWFEAECFNAMALLKSSLGKNDEAIDAYKQAIKLAPSQIFAWNNLGNLCLKINRNDEAMIAFQKAVEHNPQDAVAWNGLGDVYSALGYKDEAVAAYRKAIEHAPILHHPWNGLGDVYASMGRVEDAEAAYRKAIELNKNFVTSWRRLAYLFEKHDRNRDAVKAYQQSLRINPKNVSVWNDYGCLCLKLNKQDDAIDAFSKVIELDRSFGWAYSNLGLAYAQRNEMRESIPFHKKALEFLTSDVEKADIWNRLAEVYRSLDDYDNAVQAYRNADLLKRGNVQTEKPASPQPIADSTSEAEEAVETESALPEERSEAIPAVELKAEEEVPQWILPSEKSTGGETMQVTMPLFSRIFGGKTARSSNETPRTHFEIASDWNEKGNTHFKKGAYEFAEDAYERAIKQDHTFGWAYGNLGLAHLMQGRYGEAIILFQKSIELLQSKDDIARVWNHLGNLYRMLNDYDNAVVAYQNADMLNPDAVEVRDENEKVHSAPGSGSGLAWDELGDQFFEMGSYGEAANCYGKAIEIEPKNGFLYSNKALCLSYVGSLDDAIPLYERSLELFRDENEKALVWNRLGNVYRKMNEYDKAMDAYQHAVKLNSEQAELVTRARFSLLGNCYVD